jgi:CheY-like chemotaxis protein
MQRNFRVLVIEDDEFIREGVKDVLELENCLVETAPEGQTALEKLRLTSILPDLIFLDLNMPKMSGTDFIQALKFEEASLAQIPIIVMTAVPGARVVGVAGMLRKPMELDDIVQKLSEFRGLQKVVGGGELPIW